ncbi:TetR/AcrR family transcriptional regulator [Pseudomonas sp. JAI120]|uniref:TetR/AcrR family transcriptional regulator n=1 Tax=Pseudomonas sp. JAI120 TaxID=2723063 RepID=UPI0030ED5B2F
MSFQQVADAPTHNLQGQAVGRKGQLTRLRLIETVAELLKHRPLSEIRVLDICREASTAPGTFYLYFKDVQDLVFESIRLNQEIPPELDALLRDEWPNDQASHYSRLFVSGYVKYWEERYHLLHIRNLTADQGDERMIELRHSCLVPILECLAEKIGRGCQAENPPLNPLAGAAVIMGSLERLAAIFRVHVAPRSDMSTQDLINAEAWVLARMLGEGSSSVT